jgi:excinuclease ABC subunit B
VQPTYAQSTSRIKKPSLDDMGPGTDRPVPRREAASGQATAGPLARTRVGPATEGADQPVSGESVPARAPNVDSRAKAGAFGEGVRGPHKPTLDEMGPHAILSVPASAAPRPTRTIDVPTDKEKRGRRGRPRKTGRPGK